jgi:hypothetical protein
MMAWVELSEQQFTATILSSGYTEFIAVFKLPNSKI